MYPTGDVVLGEPVAARLGVVLVPDYCDYLRAVFHRDFKHRETGTPTNAGILDRTSYLRLVNKIIAGQRAVNKDVAILSHDYSVPALDHSAQYLMDLTKVGDFRMDKGDGHVPMFTSRLEPLK